MLSELMHISLFSSFLRWTRSITLTASLALSSILWAEVSTSKLPVLTGTDVITVESTSVGDSFTIYVRLPPEAVAEPERTFPVIYTLDGDHTFPLVASVTTQLGWTGSVPPVILVGIGYGTLDLENGNHRSRDLSPQPFAGRPDSGGGPAFHSFLIKELFPLLESSYPIDSESRYLFGHSLGGLFALYTYAKSPEHFKGIVAGSPFLAGQLNLLSETADGSEQRACRLFIITGDEEDATYFIDDLKPLGAAIETWATPDSFEIVLLPGFDHFSMVAPAISKGLKVVFAEKLITSGARNSQM